ncbi:hypothetical protein QA648_10975 [Rhizobium sp. CB3171]|uniref:hypothetical protein n=1 Tax=Rhizobium sp. CB3171 TaxID=3039157 RepID=UPI0024B22EA6|nr:hypothetical protein [Rhizobium sp. CB3171]WFU00693.1 hypothetical protein QA648_10975 [Rhizobium sp. CB3171]
MDSNLAVEHIQAKAIPAYAHLEGRWTNFLLACGNCNSSKGSKPFALTDVLLPDRDNTFLAFDYTDDGKVSVRAGLTAPQTAAATRTLELVGLDKVVTPFMDGNEKLVVTDRISKRQEAWGHAVVARRNFLKNPDDEDLLEMVSNSAISEGCFSIWMKVFEDQPAVLARLVNDHPGTRESGCFDPATSAANSPHPNADGLAHGRKL